MPVILDLALFRWFHFSFSRPNFLFEGPISSTSGLAGWLAQQVDSFHYLGWPFDCRLSIILPGRQTRNRLAWFVVRRSRQRGSDDGNDCCLGFGGLLESVEFHSKAWPPKFTCWWLVDGNVDKLAVRLKTRFQGSRSTRLVASLSAMRRRPSQEYEIWFAGSTSNVHDCLLI